MILYQILAQINKTDLAIPQGEVTKATFQTVLQMVFGVFGGAALIIVVIAGLKYVLSQGDPGQTAKAKDTILYALVGLGISVSAFAIVTFIAGKI